MKKPCYFCTDHDAKKCPERVLQHLRHIAEQAGKEQYFNAIHSVGALVQDCMRELRVVLNRPRTFLSEKSCSDSHAPSKPLSHGPSALGGESPSSPSSSSSGPAGATASSDSARRALADEANWPKWLTREAAETLPKGTERVRRCGIGYHRAYPVKFQWCGKHGWLHGADAEHLAADYDTGDVYHLPPAAKGEARVPESALIAQAVPGLEAQRERMAAAREGDAWSRWTLYCRKHPYGGMTKEQFNAFVAGECERAVREAFPITAKAGRCAACKDTILDMGVRTGGEWYHNACAPKPDAGRAEEVKCPTCGGTAEPSVIEGRFVCKDSECPVFSFAPVPTPAPKPSPGEVAEGIVKEYASHYGPMFDREMLKALVEAAITRERTTP